MNYEIVGMALFALLGVLPLAFSLVGCWRLYRKRKQSSKPFLYGAIILFCTLLLYGGVVLDAFVIEPSFPRLIECSLPGPFEKPLQIVHLSDLHLEKVLRKRDNWLVNTIQDLRPDMILITGDTHQTDNYQIDSLAQILKHINAPLGVYHCSGYDHIETLKSAAPHITFLENETAVIKFDGKDIGITGFLSMGNRTPHYEAIRKCDYQIVLNHTPDLATEAIAQDIDLYLCGHTHGGQIRIPLWGAIITNCKTGKRYEGGLYHSGKTWIHTSRGLGLEPSPAPQARFFCRPEITLFQISKAQ